MRVSRVWVLALAGCTGCARSASQFASRPEATSAEQVGPSATAGTKAAPLAVDGPPAPSGAEAPDPEKERVRAVVRSWCAALDRHDLSSLAPLYEAYVRLYGQESPTAKARVLALKRATLSESFRQEVLGSIDVVRENDLDFTARFTKRSGSEGKLADVRARLRLRRKGETQLVIIEESDAPSDEDAKARLDLDARCYAAAAAAVDGVAAVTSFETRGAKEAEESRGQWTLGGIGPEELGDRKFRVGIGFHSGDRFDGHVWYDVDRDTGSVELTVDAAPFQVGADAEAKVKEACRAR